MIHTRQDVAMYISVIKEFNLLFLAIEEFAKHIYYIVSQEISYKSKWLAKLLIIFVTSTTWSEFFFKLFDKCHKNPCILTIFTHDTYHFQQQKQTTNRF